LVRDGEPPIAFLKGVHVLARHVLTVLLIFLVLDSRTNDLARLLGIKLLHLFLFKNALLDERLLVLSLLDGPLIVLIERNLPLRVHNYMVVVEEGVIFGLSEGVNIIGGTLREVVVLGALHKGALFELLP